MPALADQDQEGRLEGVLGLVIVAQHAAAGAKDHRPVPLHQCPESHFGRLAGGGCKPFQQLSVRQPRGDPHVEKRAEMLAGYPTQFLRHEPGPLRNDCDHIQ